MRHISTRAAFFPVDFPEHRTPVGERFFGSLRLPVRKKWSGRQLQGGIPNKKHYETHFDCPWAAALASGLISFAYQESKDRYVVSDEREEDLGPRVRNLPQENLLLGRFPSSTEAPG